MHSLLTLPVRCLLFVHCRPPAHRLGLRPKAGWRVRP